MRHRVHAGYTLLLPVRPEEVDAVRAWLATAKLPFDRSTTTHFATITILPAQTYRNEPLPATLLFATSFCGPAEVHVHELTQLMRDELAELFSHCVDFHRDSDVEAFIGANRHSDCFYSGMQNLAPEDVRRNAQLRDAIEEFLGEGNVRGTAPEVRASIRRFVGLRTDLAWALEPVITPPGTWRALHARTLTILGVVIPFFALSIAGLWWYWRVVAAVWAGLVALLALLVLGVRVGESEQTYTSSRQPDEFVRGLAATQNRPVINEFVIAGPIKEEGVVRPMVLQAALWVVGWLVQGIPKLRPAMEIPTVATARWIAADEGRRLVFISNYTNAAEGYVRDFIDFPSGAMHINLSFGFGRGYPRTRWIVFDGAGTDPNAFSYVVSEHQSSAAYWYGPYINRSIDNIRIDQQIRAGLADDAMDAQTWLHLL